MTWWIGEVFLAVFAHTELYWQTGMLLSELWISELVFREKKADGSVCVCVSLSSGIFIREMFTKDIDKFNNLLFFPILNLSQSKMSIFVTILHIHMKYSNT